MKVEKDVVQIEAFRTAHTDCVRSYRIVLVLATLVLAGCGGNRSDPPPQNSEWIVAPLGQAETGRTASPAVVFVEYVTTPPDVVAKMLDMAQVTKDDVVCDLGCGDGRIIIAAAKRYGCRAVGYDLDPLRVTEARKNAERSKVAHLVTIEQKDVLTVDLEGMSVVTIYLGTEINARLIPRLSRLKAGSRIVSHNFGIGDIPPDKTTDMTSRTDRQRHRIYLWRCPFPKDHVLGTASDEDAAQVSSSPDPVSGP